MTSLKMLPVGIENFKEIRRDGFYYVDKTDLIKELLESRGKANLFTRPRRFGKSLTMSMFQSFLRSDVIKDCSMDLIFLVKLLSAMNIWGNFR